MDTSFLSIPFKGPPVVGRATGGPYLPEKRQPLKQKDRLLFFEGKRSGMKTAFDVFELYGVKSLNELKRKTRIKFRELAFKVHPDTGKRKTTRLNPKKHNNGLYFYQLKSFHDRIQKMRYVPMTLGNINELLALQKGYKTTADIDLGLNG